MQGVMYAHVVTPDAAAAVVRVRSVLGATSTAAITRIDGADTSIQVWVREHDGRLLLTPVGNVPPRLSAARQPLQAVVDVADVAPVGESDRVRARVRLDGALIPDEATPQTLWHHLAEEVRLEEDGETHQVPLGALLRARPDPLAQVEGAILAHVDTAHPEAAGLLARLLQPELLQGVVRVRPWRLDQHGIILRLTYARGSRDVRLYFPGPATEPQALNAAIRTLLDRARNQHHGRRHRRGD